MLTVYDGSTSSPFYTLSYTLPPGFFLVGPQNLPGIPHAKNRAPFHTLPDTACHSGFFLVCREDLHEIPHAHASGRTKNRAPFHLFFFFFAPFHLATSALIQTPGVQQAGGRVHQGIARHSRLAKNRAPHLIRRNEPPTGALPSNTILRFEKASHTYHLVFHSPKMSRTRCVALL